jgi:diacylglycerol kinase family enzyme
VKLVVVLNETAGTFAAAKSDVHREIADTFAAVGLDPPIEAVPPLRLRGAVRRARDEGAAAVVVGGGDGSLNTAARELAGSGCVLGILPLGTFNHLAKDLGIPLDLAGAVGVIAAGKVAALDIAEVNGRVFVNHSAIGIYPRMLRHRDLQRHRFGRSKGLATAVAMAAALRDYPTFSLRIRIGDEAITRRTPFVFIATNRYLLDAYGIGIGGGGRHRPVLLVAPDEGRLSLLRMGGRALLGRRPLDRSADALTFTSALIESRRRRLLVEIDGEYAMLRPPLRYRFRPAALGVLHLLGRTELSTGASVGSGRGRESWTGTAWAAAGSASRGVFASASAS